MEQQRIESMEPIITFSKKNWSLPCFKNPFHPYRISILYNFYISTNFQHKVIENMKGDKFKNCWTVWKTCCISYDYTDLFSHFIEFSMFYTFFFLFFYIYTYIFLYRTVFQFQKTRPQLTCIKSLKQQEIYGIFSSCIRSTRFLYVFHEI